MTGYPESWLSDTIVSHLVGCAGFSGNSNPGNVSAVGAPMTHKIGGAALAEVVPAFVISIFDCVTDQRA